MGLPNVGGNSRRWTTLCKFASFGAGEPELAVADDSLVRAMYLARRGVGWAMIPISWPNTQPADRCSREGRGGGAKRN